jgi:diguanylate cyclase (GGDEF)-like protein
VSADPDLPRQTGADKLARVDELDRLRGQVQLATRSAQQAYRDSSRLIRLLTVIGEPAPPDVLIDRTLGALSEVFAADVTCLVFADGTRGEIIAARGFSEDEVPRLPTLPGGLLAHNRLAAWVCTVEDPPEVAGILIHAAAHIPLVNGPATGEGLILIRADPTPFHPSELQMLQSVAVRLRVSVEESERREGIERLARTGHRLTRHLDVDPLLDEGLRMLLDLTGADAGVALTVDDGMVAVRAQRGEWQGIRGTWPIPASELVSWPAALRGEPFVRADLHDPTTPKDGHEPDWLRNSACIPIMDDETPVALMLAGHHRPGFFSVPMIEAATVLAGHVGSALINARLYGALAQSEAQLRILTSELRIQATHDSLTGLANRDLARQLLETSLRSEQSGLVGLLFCDLDKFKAVNDRLGHQTGDVLLRQVAERLATCLRGEDLLARLGGDEFLIVLPNVTDLEAVTQIGHRVLEALSEPFELGGERVRVAASVGGVVGERGSDRSEADAVELLRDADAAMYEAKNRGRGRVEVFDRFTAQKAVDRLTLREELLTALDRDELELNYQPIVDLDDGRVNGFEALLRWNHRKLGLIAPLVFIPMAEETGAITAIGGWVLAEACRRLAQWHSATGRPLSMAVNVSPIQLLDPAFAEKSVRTIRAAGLLTEHVWLEVTESIEVTELLSDQLHRLQAVGVRVAMDDFGMSYSNLGYLKHLPIERLKIDRTFVSGLGAGPVVPSPRDGQSGPEVSDGSAGMDRGIVRAILAIAESAGMSVVAEGIETEEQRRELIELGCRQGQGYLFARPMPAKDIPGLLAVGGLRQDGADVLA